MLSDARRMRPPVVAADKDQPAASDFPSARHALARFCVMGAARRGRALQAVAIVTARPRAAAFASARAASDTSCGASACAPSAVRQPARARSARVEASPRGDRAASGHKARDMSSGANSAISARNPAESIDNKDSWNKAHLARRRAMFMRLSTASSEVRGRPEALAALERGTPTRATLPGYRPIFAAPCMSEQHACRTPRPGAAEDNSRPIVLADAESRPPFDGFWASESAGSQSEAEDEFPDNTGCRTSGVADGRATIERCRPCDSLARAAALFVTTAVARRRSSAHFAKDRAVSARS
mmetsp:Transcript_22456/g.72727  ORF Transcript_22456/g.72727 Transcript_22456/m.72727 type:complete len:299 (+) Transcript_22456:303-1199(+)